MSQYIGSNTLLAANQSYTSPAVITDRYATISGTVFSDQPGVLHIRQGDGEFWDADDSVAVTALTPTKFSIPLIAAMAQVEYINGATNQGVFRLNPRFINTGDDS